jgi:hypothetical protein
VPLRRNRTYNPYVRETRLEGTVLQSIDIATMQGLGVLAIAFLGLCIAWGQWVTARSKLVLDLYDKRRAVYSKFHGLSATRQRRFSKLSFQNLVVALSSRVLVTRFGA